MINFLFWNTYQKDLSAPIAEIIVEKNIDIVLIAESNLTEYSLNSALQKKHSPSNFRKKSYLDGLEIYIKDGEISCDVISGAAKHLTCKIKVDGIQPIFVFLVHLRSRLYAPTDSEQKTYARNTVSAIREIEKEYETERTLVVGDFNFDPYSTTMVAADSFHAVSSKEVVKKESRVVDTKSYPYFYNPMWSLYTDDSRNASGTYYYNQYKVETWYWHIYDQILLRNSLVPFFDEKTLEILKRTSNFEFAVDGKPDDKKFSDHFPISFSLKI